MSHLTLAALARRKIAIVIRATVTRNGRFYLQVGADIVYDSDPEKEWDETMNKGRALFRAVAQVAGGL